MMKYNQDNVKLKYILGIYKDMPGYPTGDDILYYVIKRHFEKDKTGDVLFTDNLLIKKLGEEHFDTIMASLSDLLKRGLISIRSKTNDSTSYKVLKNDYIDAV